MSIASRVDLNFDGCKMPDEPKTYNPSSTVEGDSRLREQLGLADAVPEEPGEAAETPTEAPRLWDWFWLADRFVGALEALVAGHIEQKEQEQHECRPQFMGDKTCFICGKELG
jgi:hypothetical protein